MYRIETEIYLAHSEVECVALTDHLGKLVQSWMPICLYIHR